MSKSKPVFDELEIGISVSSLFRKPVSYQAKPVHKTLLIIPFKGNDGVTMPKVVCVEDKMKDITALDFNEVKLQNLVDKGVSPKSLDMIDTNRLGIDASFDTLATSIVRNSSDYIEQS